MKKRIPAAALSLALLASLAAPASALEVEDARTLLEKYYVDDLPAAVLEAETVDEMLRLLGDPYTVYYTAEEYAEFMSAIDGETLVGIGVSFHNAFDNGFEILSVFPNSPALEAGLQAGDVIIAVEGVPLTASDSLASRIAGEEGMAVTITVRTAEGVKKDVTMVRRTVQAPIVTYEQAGSAGYIVCDSFGESAPDAIREALAAMDENSTVWVMDLRSNPGGTSDSAAEAAGAFLGSKVMVYFRSGSGAYYKTSTTLRCEDMTDKPLIILTGSRSASASELFSAAIRDYRAGISIGERTFGKGVAQKLYTDAKYPELFDGDALKITVYRFFSPEGATNHIIGIIPTLLVDKAHTETIAMLLSSAEPEQNLHNWKLTLCGKTFYLDNDACQAEPEAFTALLEALPPSAKLYRGTGGSKYWREITPAQAAEECGLAGYTPRTFSDLEGHPYQTGINTLATYDLISGGDDGLFHPEQSLTRAQLAVMLTTALDLSPSSASPVFSDVAEDAWYAGAVSAMTAKGFMSGTGADTFSPDATLTTQELLTVYSAVAAWASMEGYELSQKDVSAVQWAEFYEYPEWAQAAARNMDELGLTVDRENPGQTVTRGTAAGQLYQLLKSMHILWN